jgi:ATP-dependent Clp protease ATP-binding subunit ClpC
MFQRFTDQARRAVEQAQEEARTLHHNYIGTEHILLGLIHEGDGVAAEALESLGIRLETIRQQVQEIIGRGQQAPLGHIAFTPRAKKVLELSLREALQLGHDYVGTEHILLGVIREGDGVAAQATALRVCDIDFDRRRIDVRQAFSDVGGRVVLGTPKPHQSRTVPIPRFAATELAAAVDGKRPDDLVFTMPGGSVTRLSNWRRATFLLARSRAGPSDRVGEPHCGGCAHGRFRNLK